jgi:hypothetical protein
MTRVRFFSGYEYTVNDNVNKFLSVKVVGSDPNYEHFPVVVSCNVVVVSLPEAIMSRGEQAFLHVTIFYK